MLFTITRWSGGGPGRCPDCGKMRKDRAIIEPTDHERYRPDSQGLLLSMVAQRSRADQANVDRWTAHWMQEQLAGRIHFAPLQRICRGCARARLEALLDDGKGTLIALAGRRQPKLRTALFFGTRAGDEHSYTHFVLNTVGSESARDLVRIALRAYAAHSPDAPAAAAPDQDES